MVTDGIGTRPTFILCSPRSGSTIFFRTLGCHPDLVSLGTESQQVFNSIPALHPSASGWHSGRLTAADATPAVAGALNSAWLEGLESRYGRPLADPIRFLEKTPHTCLKVLDDVAALEPDAWTMVAYEEFVARPTETMNQVTRFLGIAPLGDVRLPAGPDPGAWRWAESELAPLLPGLTPVWERLQTAQRSRSSGHARPRMR